MPVRRTHGTSCENSTPPARRAEVAGEFGRTHRQADPHQPAPPTVNKSTVLTVILVIGVHATLADDFCTAA
jgi:hypothetical protein